MEQVPLEKLEQVFYCDSRSVQNRAKGANAESLVIGNDDSNRRIGSMQ